MRDAGTAAPTTDSRLTRLRGTADRLAALAEEMQAEKERRDSLIVELRDAMVPWGQIARAGRLSSSRCVAIVGGG